MDDHTIRGGLPRASRPDSPEDHRAGPQFHRVTALTRDEAAAVCRRYFSAATFDVPPGDDTPFLMRTEVLRLGPVTVGQLTMLPRLLVTAPAVEGYHVTVPVAGDLRALHSGTHVLGRPCRTAVVYRPGGATTVEHDPGGRQLQIKIERAALEAELEALVDRPVRGVVDLAPSMDIGSGPGRSWAQLARLLHDESHAGDGLILQPLIAERLWRSLVSGLLLAVGHRWYATITQPVAAGPPRAVRRVVDAIEGEPQLPYTVRDLARIGGVSVRSLQEGFRRHMGVSPTAYLQQVRLARSHLTLREADPQGVTVASVAHRWGFAHLGRFARAYRARYGVHPSTTLRREC
jgi:AraC-like DNA-binding protein